MMGRQVEAAQLFCEFSLDRHVPSDHLLRRDLLIKRTHSGWRERGRKASRSGVPIHCLRPSVPR